MENMTREQFLKTELRGLNKVKEFIANSPAPAELSIKEFLMQLDTSIEVTKAELEIINAKKKKIKAEQARLQRVKEDCARARETYRILYEMYDLDKEEYESAIQYVERIYDRTVADEQELLLTAQNMKEK